MSTLKAAVEECGGVSAIAKELGATPQRLSNWIERGVPVEHCAALEHALRGKATRREMRPHDWRRIWPELVANEETASSGDAPPPPSAGLDTRHAAPVGG